MIALLSFSILPLPLPTMNPFQQLLSLLKPLGQNIRRIYLLSALQGLFYVAVPLGIQAVITYTMTGKLSASLFLLCGLTVLCLVFVSAFQLWQMRLNETIQQSLLVFFGVKFSEKISHLRPDLYLNEYLPSKINQFFDVLTLQKGLTKILTDVSFAVISIILCLLILSAYSPLFLIFTLIVSVLYYFLLRYYGHRSMEASLNESKRKYQFVDWLQNLFIGLKNQDKTFSPDFVFHETEQKLGHYIDNKTKNYQVLEYQFKSILMFKVLFTALVLLVGVLFVQWGFLNIGQFVAAEVLVVLIINGVEKIVVELRTIYDVVTATEKLYQVLELDQNEDYKTHKYYEELHNKLIARIYNHTYSKKIKAILYTIGGACIIILFLPWNQTIQSEGAVTTLSPTDRPQNITSRISGRIEKWYIKEGDFLKKGDTLALISEIKEDYMDPKLVERTQSQVKSKESAIQSYESKINAIDAQIDAINKAFPLKMSQAKNKVSQLQAKVRSDSASYASIANNYKITTEQFQRFESLLSKGVISKTDYENRKARLQDGYAKVVEADNKLMIAKNELTNALIELNSVKQEYNEKLMKAESDKFSTLSTLYDAEAGLTKMQNQLSNYSIRNGFYYVLCPQDGYVTRTFKQGVGDLTKEGEALVSFVPSSGSYSIELYIEPMDLPLVQNDQKIQITFDGWPAFVFSGWPGISFGTYQATVVSVDRVISANGKFRVLAKKDKEEWPYSIQVGSGVKGIFLLKEVPVVYELWRNINGFPPEFYKAQNLGKPQKEAKNEK
jgi:multidrug resistance efflux pump